MPDVDTAIDRLFAVAPDEFVAERTRLARELRAAGDRPAAAEVAKLPKPTAPAWALNRAARHAAAAVAGWLAAAEALRAASAPGAAGDLRAAMAAHREATAALVAAAADGAREDGRPLSEPMLDRLRALLTAATADPALGEAVRAGRVVEGREAAPLPAAPPAPPPQAQDDGRERRRAELERRAGAAMAELDRLRDELARRDAAAQAAEARLEEARQAIQRAESEAAAAHGAVADAREAVAGGERRLRELREALREV